MRLAWALLLSCVRPPPATGPQSAPALPVVQTLKVLPPEGVRLDPSGLARWQGQWITVSDKVDGVYRLVPEGADLQAEAMALELPDPTGGTSPAGRVQACGGAAGRFDLEGVAVCGSSLLLVSEAQNSLLRVDAQGAQQLRLDLDAVSADTQPALGPRCGWGNAGLEGVACAGERIWVAKEREPRLIYQVAPDGSVQSLLGEDIAAQDTPGKAGIRGAFWPSYSDLFAVDGRLYALERHSHSVLRLDPETGALEQRVALDFQEAALYDYSEPYGLAEGLFVDEARIWVLLDSGAHPLAETGEQAALLLAFDRPEGF